MTTILNFSDLGCLNESAAGSAGAGMASFVRAGFPAARGFVVTPVAFSDFLKKDEIAAALDMFGSGAEDPEDSWRTVKALFARTRLNWSHEMDILAAFGELDSTVSISTTSKYGATPSPVYAGSGQDLLDGIKHSWLRWLKTGMGKARDQDMPAVLVKEVLDSEVSIELRKKGVEIRARAVFGLPEGLTDPGVSSDIFEISPDGKLDRMEMRPQDFQFVMKDHGPSRVTVSKDFRDEEKVSGEMLVGLNDVTSFMRENVGIVSCVVCYISSRPVICSAVLMSDPGAVAEVPPRERSMSLLEPVRPQPPVVIQAPVVATRLFLQIENAAELLQVGETYMDGVMVSGSPLSADGSADAIGGITSEAKRKLRASSIILELGDTQPQTLKRLAGAVENIRKDDIQPGILIPGIHSAEELAKVLGTIDVAMGGSPRPQIWMRVMYPSNLFFMDSLAAISDVQAVDLDSLGRLMLGGDGSGQWMRSSVQTIEKALEQPLAGRKGHIAVMANDLVSTPGLLEYLVRGGVDILCIKPSEVQTVRHIVASVEKRMLLEQGRV